MIDYDKLKIAHELTKNSDNYYLHITLGMDDGTMTILDANRNDEQFVYDTESIDDLITKLRELTKQEPAEPGYVSEILEEIKPINGVLTLPAGDYIFKDGVTYKVKKIDKPPELTEPKRKYKVGDQIVVYGWNEEIYEEVVTKCECIPAKEPSWTYNDWIEDNYHRIYPTKAALIAAQIKYWANLGKYCEHDVIYSTCEQCKEPEYCNVSGAKLGKSEECEHEPSKGTTGCQHENPYIGDSGKYYGTVKCTKCGELYQC